MLRKLLIAGAVLLVVAVGLKAVSCEEGRPCLSKVGEGIEAFGDFVCSFAAADRDDAVKQPTAAQVRKVNREIARLEKEKQGLATKIALLKLDIQEVKGNIAVTTAKLENGKKALVTWTAALEKNQTLVFNGEEFSEGQLKQKISDTYGTCQLLEGQLKTDRNLLSLKQKRHDALYTQVTQLATKINEFRIRLETVRTEEKLLENERLSNPANTSKSGVSNVDRRLKAMERAQKVERLKNQILNQSPFTTEGNQNGTGPSADINYQEIRNYANGNANQKRTETVNNK